MPPTSSVASVFAAVHAARSAVKSAKAGLFHMGASESFRIVLNAAKVLSHLFSGSLVYCAHFPKSMNFLMDAAAMFALNLVSETKLPCHFVSFDFYTRVIVAAVGPIVVSAFVFAACLVHTSYNRKRQLTVRELQRQVTRPNGCHCQSLNTCQA